MRASVCEGQGKRLEETEQEMDLYRVEPKSLGAGLLEDPNPPVIDVGLNVGVVVVYVREHSRKKKGRWRGRRESDARFAEKWTPEEVV